jgi:hypothetical protein
MRYVVDKKDASETDFKQAAKVAKGAYFVGTSLRAIFTTDADHRDWLKSENLLPQVQDLNARRDKVMRLADRNDDLASQAQSKIAQARNDYLGQILKTQKADMTNASSVERMNAHSYLLGGASMVLLWENCGFSGQLLFLGTGFFPSFSWMNFNDKASSIQWLGLNVTIWENDWFSGGWKTFFLIGQTDCLVADGFNDKASSAICAPGGLL